MNQYLEILEKILSSLPNSLIEQIGFIDIGTKDGLPKEVEFIAKEKISLYLYEPNKAFFDKLNLIYNKPNHNIFNQAVSNFSGEANFYYTKMNSACSLNMPNNELIDQHNLKAFKVKNKDKVEVTNLYDSLAKNLTKSFAMKLDAQGEELKILEGAKDLINKIPFVVVELDFMKRYENSDYLKVLNKLNDLGYELLDFVEINYFKNFDITSERNRMFFADGLFIAKNLQNDENILCAIIFLIAYGYLAEANNLISKIQDQKLKELIINVSK